MTNKIYADIISMLFEGIPPVMESIITFCLIVKKNSEDVMKPPSQSHCQTDSNSTKSWPIGVMTFLCGLVHETGDKRF